MIVSGRHTARTTLDPFYWLGDYAAYRNASGIILAHIPSKESVFFQPGEDANEFENKADEIMHAIEFELCFEDAWDLFCSQYLEIMQSPNDAGGEPSSDGGFFILYD